MKYVNLSKKIEDQNFVFIIISFFLSFIFFKGRLGGDDLQSFIFAFNLIETFNYNLPDYLQDPSNGWQFSHRKIWILQNSILISIFKVVNSFIFFDLKYFSNYFCGWLLTFYSFYSFFLFLKILLINKININLSILISISVFFGTSLISFFTGAYIESLVVLLILLRLISKNKKIKFLIDVLLVLIKPYYFIVVICLVYDDLKISRKSIFYLFSIFIIVVIEKILTFNAFSSFVTTLPVKIEVEFMIKNIFNMFFSLGFGIFFTSTVLFFLILIGSEFKTLFKFSILFLFIIILSAITFWHGQSPGGRYLVSCLFIFVPEIVESLKRLNNYKIKNIFFIAIFLITILNLPSLEYRNTNIKNYSDNAVTKGVAESPSDRDIKAFPINDFNFNNIIFAQNIFWNKIFKKENKIIKIKNYSFKVKNVYPMTGLKRIMFITENRLDYVNEKLILDVNSSILIILKILYYFTFIFVFIIFLFSLNNCLKYNEKNKHNNPNLQ